MGLNEDRHLSGERPTIRSDIDFRVIDTVEFAGNLKERLERGKSWMKSYWNFRGHFIPSFFFPNPTCLQNIRRKKLRWS